MTRAAAGPELMSQPSDRAAAQEEAARRVMQDATDQPWTIGVPELGMAALPDILDDAAPRQARQEPDEPLPES